MQLLRWLGAVLSRLGALVFPAAGKVRAAAPAAGRGLRWGLHFVVLAAGPVALYFLTQPFNLPQSLPVFSRELARVWLPVLFLLFYLLCWLAWWLWQLLAVEEEASHFPDIDEAWAA